MRLAWTLVALIVAEMWGTATVVRVHRGGDGDILTSEADVCRFMRYGVTLHVAITVAAILLAIYGHIIAERAGDSPVGPFAMVQGATTGWEKARP